MQLLTKTTLYFLLVMVPLLGLGAGYLYYQISREINEKADQELLGEEIQWIRYLHAETGNGTAFILKSTELLIAPNAGAASPYPEIRDLDIPEPQTGKNAAYRQLSHIVPVNDVNYLIIIRKSLEQRTLLLGNMIRIMLLVFIGLFLVSILFVRLISSRLWRPFKRSLEKIRKVELSKMEGIRFTHSNILEFNELNISLNTMTSKIHDDYVNMKEFTENAAHEMQTPLAVAQSKLELLLQDADLSDEQVTAIIQANDALTRLAKLNQSLLLLARIGNNQYESLEISNLSVLVRKYLQLFEEIIRHKKITVHTVYENDFTCKMHPLLAESLISNLLGNAVKYNYEGGDIYININSGSIKITNTSLQPPLLATRLFNRFYRSDEVNDFSNGLGLAIVKKIADTHQLTIYYRHRNNRHEFSLTLQNEKDMEG